jgi:hypothetical protein
LIKVRVKPVDILGYTEDLSLMALFGRNTSKMEEATLAKTAHTRLFCVEKKQIWLLQV